MKLPEMIDRITGSLQGLTRDQDEQTWITGDMTSSDLTVRVAEPKMISQGICQVGDELVWVSRVDNTTGDVTLAPFGRGYQSTTAASHAANSAMVNSPKYPRSDVRNAISDTIESVYPDLYVVATTEFPYIAARSTYELPADVDAIQRVTWQTIGPTRRWADLRRYDFNPQADPDTFTSGKSLDILTEPVPGQTIRVTYIKAPNVFTDDTTEFATATGLSATAQDCIIYGACFRLVGFTESSRIQLHSIEAQLRAQMVQPGSSQHAARHYLQLYQLALQSERERLLRANPTSSHFRYI